MPAPAITRGVARARDAFVISAFVALAAAGGTPASAGSRLAQPASAPGDTLALGDTISGSLATAAQVDTFFVTLAAGDRIDIAVYGQGTQSLFFPAVRVVSPAGALLWTASSTYALETGRASVLPNREAGSAGTYRIEVQSQCPACSTSPGYYGGYVLKVRRSGAIAALSPWNVSKYLVAAHGSLTVSDTIWVYNTGGQQGTWSVTPGDPRVTASITGGLLSAATSPTAAHVTPAVAGTQAVAPTLTPDASHGLEAQQFYGEPEPAPAGATPMIVTVNLNGVGEGFTQIGRALRIENGDGWLGPVVLWFDVWLHDPAQALVTDSLPYMVHGMARQDDGQVVVAAGGRLWRVDPATGAKSEWVSLGVSSHCLLGLDVTADGTAYVGDRCTQAIRKVTAVGVTSVLTSALDTPYDVTVLPDGTLYAVESSSGLWRITPDGTKTNVANAGSGHLSVTHDPTDGSVYFTQASAVHRYDPSANTTVQVAALSSWAYAIERGASGRWYVKHPNGVGTYDATWSEIDWAGGTERGFGLALVDGDVLSNTFGCIDNHCVHGQLYRTPVSDGPQGTTAKYLNVFGPSTAVLRPGATKVDTLRVTATNDAAVGVKVTNSASWLTVTPDTAQTPFNLLLTYNATGLANGVYMDTVRLASSQAGLSLVKVPVRLEVSDKVVTLGDTVPGSLATAAQIDTFYVTLAAGDRIDIAVYGQGTPLLYYPRVEFLSPTWSLLGVSNSSYDLGWGNASVIPNREITASGTYRIAVRSQCTGCGAGYSGGYVLKVRRGGAVLAMSPSSVRKTLSASHGVVTTSDTIWVYNAGAGAGTWTVTSLDARVTLSAAGGPLTEGTSLTAEQALRGAQMDTGGEDAGPMGAAGEEPAGPRIYREPELAPAGSVPVVVTVALTGFAEARHYLSNVLQFENGDGWVGPALVDLEVWVHDPVLQIVADALPYRVHGMARQADGQLLMAVQGGLWRMDPATGARTEWVNLGVSGWCLYGLDVAADGTVYVADNCAGSVRKVTAAGVASVLTTGLSDSRDVAVLPDGVAYAVAWSTGLWRIAVDGTTTNVASAGTGGHTSVAYDATDGSVYFTHWNVVYRYDPVANTTAQVGTLSSGTPYALERGASGRWYVKHEQGIWTYSETWQELDRAVGTNHGFGLALLDGGVLGNTHGCLEACGPFGQVYRVPVSDAPYDPSKAYVAVSGPTSALLRPGATKVDTLRVTATAGAALSVKVTKTASWLTLTPDTAQTPFDLVLTYDATGLASGAYTDTLRLASSQAGLSPVRVPVRLEVSDKAVVLGDTVLGTLATSSQIDTFYVSLAAGDRVDMAVRGLQTTIRFYNPTGGQVAVSGGVYDPGPPGYWLPLLAGQPAATSGTYRIEVQANGSPGSGDYVLKVRRSGAVLALSPSNHQKYLTGPVGGTARDTIWVYNAGAQAGTWTATSLDARVTLSAAGGALSEGTSLTAEQALRGAQMEADGDDVRPLRVPGEEPAGPQIYREPEMAPAGSVPVVVTVDLGGFTEDRHWLSNVISFENGDGWVGPALVDLEVWAHDPALAVVVDSLPYRPWGMARQANGQVVVAAGGRLWRVDPATGAKTEWVNLGVGTTCLYGLDVGADGTVYVGDHCSQAVRKVTSAGEASVRATGLSNPRDVAVLPDGVVYAVDGGTGLWRIAADGTKTNVASAGGLAHQSVAYDPTDGSVYFTHGSLVYRYDPLANATVQVGSIWGPSWDLERGASGRWYAKHSTGVWTYSAAWQEVDRAVGPTTGYGLALVDGALLANTHGCLDFCGPYGQLYRLPVNDSPLDPTKTYLDAPGETSAILRPGGMGVDTLRVTATAGAALGVKVTKTAPWLTVTPDTAQTPFDLMLTYDATGLASGVYTDTLRLTSSQAGLSPVRVPVRLEVSDRALALGDTILGSLATAAQIDTFYVALTAGDRIDLAVHGRGSPSLWYPNLFLFSPTGTQLASTGWSNFYDIGLSERLRVLPNRTITTSGVYRIEVRSNSPTASSTGYSGGYVLKVRRSGSLLALSPSMFSRYMVGQEGSVARDTIWVYNAGGQAGTWTVTSLDARVTLSAAGGPLTEGTSLTAEQALRSTQVQAEPDVQGPAPAPSQGGEGVQIYQSAELAPAGSVPVVVTVALGGIAEGRTVLSNVVRFDNGDGWVGPALMDLEVSKYGPTLEIVGELPAPASGVAPLDDGRVVVASGGQLWRVDPVTRDAQAWITVYQDSIFGLTDVIRHGERDFLLSSRRAWNFASPANAGIFRLTDSGDLTTLSLEPSATDLVVLPGDTILFANWALGLTRLNASGDTTLLASGHQVGYHETASYNPQDGWVYFSNGSSLYRYDPRSGSREYVQSSPYLYDVLVSATGHRYQLSVDGIDVVSPGGVLLRRLGVPGRQGKLGLANGWLYGTTVDGLVYRLPVDDGPYLPERSYVAVSGPTGAILRPDRTGLDTLRITATGDAALGVKVTKTASWLNVTPDTAQTPFDLVLGYNPAGLANGIYTDTLRLTSAQAGLSPVNVPVRLEVSDKVVVLGDTILGTLATSSQIDTFWATLAAGDRIDLAVYGRGTPSLWYPDLRLFSPTGTQLASATSSYYDRGVNEQLRVLPNREITTAGTYRIEIRSQSPGSTSGGFSGGYVMKVRRSAALLVMSPSTSWKSVTGPSGGTARDTIWVYNAGAQAGTWTATSLDARVTLSAAGGPLTEGTSLTAEQALRGAQLDPAGEDVGPARAPGVEPAGPQIYGEAELAPAGAVPVVVTVNLAGFTESRQVLSNVVRFENGDGWVGPALVDLEVWAHDPALEVLADSLPYRVAGMARRPDGHLVTAAGGRLWIVDAVTGAKTEWVNLGVGTSCLYGLDVATDGTVYVADWCEDVVRKVTPGGEVSVLASGLPTPYDVAALPDGTVYAVEVSTGLWRVAADGAKTNVASAGTGSHTSVAYDPTDGSVYFTRSNLVYRYDPAVNSSAQVGTLTGGTPYALERGASGRWYVKHTSGVWTYSAAWQEGDRAIGTNYGYGLTLLDGVVIGNTDGCVDGFCGPYGQVYRVPVNDGPHGTAVKYVSVSGATNVVIPLGAAKVDTLRVTATNDAALGVKVTKTAAWLTVAPDTAQTPFDLVVTYNATGLAAGAYTDTMHLASSQAGVSPVKVPVRLDVSDRWLSLGDTILGSLATAAEIDTFYVTLEAGDHIDVAAYGRGTPPLWYPSLRLFSPAGSELAVAGSGFYDRGVSERPSVLPNHEVTEGGTYRIEVRSSSPGSTSTGYWGGYVLKVRRSGAVLALSPRNSGKELTGPEGGTASDTIWVYNAGAQSGTWTVTSLDARVTVSTAGGPLTEGTSLTAAQALRGAQIEPEGDGVVGPARAAGEEAEGPQIYREAELAPPGSVPVLVTMNLIGLGQNRHTLSNVIRFENGDGWVGPALVDLDVWVRDPALEVVADSLPYSVWGMARRPDGQVVVAASGRLWNVEPATGAKSEWVTLDGNNACLFGLDVAPDGTVYVADRCFARVWKVTGAGVASVLTTGLPGVYGVAALPGGVVYAVADGTGLWRIAADGTKSNVAAAGASGHQAVAYDPTDGGVYFAQSNRVYRYDPRSGMSTQAGSLWGTPLAFARGAGGRWYVKHHVGVWTYDAAWQEVHRAVGTNYGYGLALLDGAVLGNTQGCVDGFCGPFAQVYRVPVSDAPLDRSKEYLTVAGGSGAIVPPGSELVDTLRVGTVNGSALGVRVTKTTTWLTVTPDTAQTPFDLVLRYNATGLAPGTYTDTLRFASALAGVNPVERVLRLQVPGGFVALGDTVSGSLAGAAEADTFYLALSVGDTLDLGAFAAEGATASLTLELRSADGGLVAQAGTAVRDRRAALLPRRGVAASGTYQVIVKTTAAADYVLKVRRSGPVLNVVMPTTVHNRNVMEGHAQLFHDTVWVRNVGSGAGGFTLSVDQPWASLSVTSGTVMPSGGAVASVVTRVPGLSGAGGVEAPASLSAVLTGTPPSTTDTIYASGDVAIVLTRDVSGVPPGLHTVGVRVEPVDPWAGGMSAGADARVWDSRSVTVASMDVTPRHVQVAPDGSLLVAVSGALRRYNPTTGSYTVAASGFSPTTINHFVVSGDGTVYAALDGTAGQVVRVVNGAIEPYVNVGARVTHLALGPAGEVYALAGSTSVRVIRPDLSMSEVATVPFGFAMGYDPTGHHLYLVGGSNLVRVDPETGVVTTVGPVPPGSTSIWIGITVGRNRIYGMLNHIRGYAAVMDRQGNHYAPLVGPSLGWGVAVAEGKLYGTGDFHGSMLFSMPVDDGPISPPSAATVPMWVPRVTGSQGDTVKVSVHADLTQVGGSIGSYEARVQWDTAVAKHVAVAAGAFQGTFTANTDSASAGVVRFAGVSTDGTANRDTTLIGELRLVVTGSGGDSSVVALTVPSLAKTTFEDLTALVRATPGVLKVSSGRWGDPNRDGNITALDALICLSHVVGKTLPAEFDATACDVAPDDGEAFTGRVTALDALAILSHVVGKVLPATFRVGRGR